MKLFGFRINSGEIKDVREIEKTLESIEEKKNKIIDLAGQLSTLTEIKFKYSADGSIEKKFEVDGFGESRAFYFRDPDGIILEMMQPL